jgi:predicted phage tail protein
MKELVKVKLHGKLGEAVGQKEWELEVSSVAEAIHAINVQTGEKIRSHFLDGANLYTKYQVIADGKNCPFLGDFKHNDLTIKKKNLKEIDIVPLIEGSDLENPWWAIGLGIVGLSLATTQWGVMASLTILTQGLSNLLAKPPPPPENRQITNPSSDPAQLANSYLFSGPANVINEGGPVPLGYGRLMVGSQVILASYDVKHLLTKDAGYVA